jgi:ABC-type protease/lipase transport system fused ATPase/permease subunit
LVIATIITLQIHDRVLTSQGSEALLMLWVAAALSLAAWWATDTSAQHAGAMKLETGSR